MPYGPSSPRRASPPGPAAGVTVADLPAPAAIDLLIVDWGDRQPGWDAALVGWHQAAAARPRIVLFGPHSDLASHASASTTGLGPMKARSALFAGLPALLGEFRPPPA